MHPKDYQAAIMAILLATAIICAVLLISLKR